VARQPKPAKKAARQARRVPDKPAAGPQHYRADAAGEIEDGDGVMRVEPGDFVVTGSDGRVSVMPPERFAEAFGDAGEA